VTDVLPYVPYALIAGGIGIFLFLWLSK